MRFQELVRTSERVAAAPGRREKVGLVAGFLSRVESAEALPAVAWLAGTLRQGRIGVGPAALAAVSDVPPVADPSLPVSAVHAALSEIAAASGPGSEGFRRERLARLFGRATAEEQRFLARLLLGELRQGAQEAIVLEGLARSTGIAAARVRRAVMLVGDPWEVAETILLEGPDGLDALSIRLFRPVKPMLAQTADGVEEALERLGRAALEWKLDGGRIQAHKRDGEVRIYTRRLNEATDALPEVVEVVRALAPRELVLDGEAIALDAGGRPRPFQETMRRFGRVRDVRAARRALPLSTYWFDCLLVDGEPLIDLPAIDREAALRSAVPTEERVRRRVTDTAAEAAAFLRAALSAGHEGLVAKALDAPYTAGRRGSAWLKVKPVRTADLVILAAEWGHGRRRGWLSNLHLGAGAPEGGFAMVGKTFKGLTDEMLQWQTERLLALERAREGHLVRVRPELVVEVAFDGVQRSPRYASGLALRFARVRSYREDKPPSEADTVATLRKIRDGSA